MRIFIDTDVLLDVALGREPYFASSSELLDWAESHPGSIAVSWHGMANLAYLIRGNAGEFIKELLAFAVIPHSGTEHMHLALDMEINDIEDAMQVAVAGIFHARAIITRNTKDYRQSPIQAMTPEQFLKSRKGIN